MKQVSNQPARISVATETHKFDLWIILQLLPLNFAQ